MVRGGKGDHRLFLQGRPRGHHRPEAEGRNRGCSARNNRRCPEWHLGTEVAMKCHRVTLIGMTFVALVLGLPGIVELVCPTRGVSVADLGTGSLTEKLPPGAIYRLPQASNAIAFCQDGGMLATRSRSGILSLWTFVDRKPVLRGRTQDQSEHPPCTPLVFSSDCKQLIAAGPDQTIRAWEIPAFREIWKVPTEMAWLRTFGTTISPDMQWFLLQTYPTKCDKDCVFELRSLGAKQKRVSIPVEVDQL